ncbi:ferredoxin-dependent glutamate synthase 2 [archaeon]|nr:ferredoxin-dependent glutamate synthase 2 [archaeon]
MLQEFKKIIREEEDFVIINAKGIYYRELNELINELILNGAKKFRLLNINGQRFIADGLRGGYYIEIYGTAGDDLGGFANGPTIVIHGNIQDGAGNTMNEGKIIVHGSGTDIIGHSMRGGKIFVKGEVGYRVGIHMKEYKEQIPVIVVGATAGDFLGEYMAGGRIIILGLEKRPEVEDIVGDWIGTGIHGGAIYIRGVITKYKLGYSASIKEIDENDRKIIEENVREFCSYFGLDAAEILKSEFTKIAPISRNPFAAMYSDSRENK